MSPSKDEPPSGSSAPKLSMKGFSLSSKPSTKPKPPPSSTLGKRPRSTFQSQDNDDSGSDSEDHGGSRRGRHEAVTGFAEGGAISRKDERRKEPVDLVIPKIANRDWRGEVKAKKGRKNLLPPEVQRQIEEEERMRRGEGGEKAEGVDVVNSKDGEIQWGLTVRAKREVGTEEGVSTRSTEEVVEGSGEDKQTDQAAQVKEEKPKTADEEALAALLGNRDEKKGPDLVIPVAAAAAADEPISEADAYRRAIAAAPEASTLEDYERVPVEEFGAALLRGMGWKGEKKGQVREVKRRQNLLGLGAKELKDAEELGAWVQKSDTKRLKERRSGGGGSERERRPKPSEYKREKERRDERRDKRGGGGHRGERERERERDYRERNTRR